MRGPVADDSGALLAQPREPLQQYADLLRQRGQALDAIGRESDLDVDGVVALCDRVIEVAKKDQKGQYTE